MAQLVETMRHNPEGRGFDSQLGHSFNHSGMVLRSNQPPLGGKGGQCSWLTTLQPSCSDCLEILEASSFCPGLYRDSFTHKIGLTLLHAARVFTTCRITWHQMCGFRVTEEAVNVCWCLYDSVGREPKPSARANRIHKIRQQAPDMKLNWRFVQYYSTDHMWSTDKILLPKHDAIKVYGRSGGYSWNGCTPH